MSRRSSHEVFAAVVTTIMSGPRTKNEISKYTGICLPSVCDVVDILHDRLTIYVQDWRVNPFGAPPAAVFAWQPEIGRYSDAVLAERRARKAA